jgi:adenosylmethionine-8-amino-7-oxononanoate aminotransferase
MAAPFVTGGETYMHGLTYSGHPLTTAIASSVIGIYQRERVLDNVRALTPRFEAGLQELRRIPIVGDVRGMGFFWALEMVKDRETKELFDAHEADWLLRSELSRHMDELGLLCRLDDRGEPVIQLSPPLVSDAALLDRIVDIVGTAADRASHAWSGSSAATADPRHLPPIPTGKLGAA